MFRTHAHTNEQALFYWLLPVVGIHHTAHRSGSRPVLSTWCWSYIVFHKGREVRNPSSSWVVVWDKTNI